MEFREKILIIDEEKNIVNLLKTVLRANKYEALSTGNGAEGLSLISSSCPDLIILDLNLPDMDGIEVLRYLREWSTIPVIVLSARTHEKYKVEALDLGADDYITKPFGVSELLARIRSAMRRRHPEIYDACMVQSELIKTGALTIDYNKHRVFVDGIDACLTQTEFRLVSFLGKHAGRVVTYTMILREIWGPNQDEDNRILRVNMANIRRKIEKNPAEPEYIFTEPGVGYYLKEPDLD